MVQRGRKADTDSLDLAYDEGEHCRIQREKRVLAGLYKAACAEDERILEEMARLEGREKERVA